MSEQHELVPNGRRDFLKKTSAGVLGIPLLTRGKGSNRNAGTLVHLKGTPGNPLSKKQINRNIRILNRKAQANTASQAPVLPIPDFDVPGQKVVSYVLKIGSDGVPMAFIGSTVNDSSSNHSSNANSKGEKHAAMMSNATTAEDYTTSTDISIQSSSVNFGSRWVKQSLTTAYTDGANGEVKLQGNHARYDQDYDGDPNKDLWGASFVHRATPYNNIGIREVNRMEARQNWSFGFKSPQSPYITKTEPNGKISGTKTYNAELSYGVSGPSGTIGWTYSQPDFTMVERTDQNGNDNDAVWKYDASSTYDSTLEQTCGSLCWFNQIACGPVDSGSWGKAVNESHFNGPFGSTLTASAKIIGKEC